MNLEYAGQETVAAGPDAVWAFLQDPARVAACLPGLEDVKVTGPGELEGHVPFGSGFLRGRLRVHLQVNTDPAAGRVTVRAQGGGLGNTLNLTAGADVKPHGDARTLLDWSGQAELRGPAFALGGRAVEAQAERLVARTFRTLGDQIARSAS